MCERGRAIQSMSDQGLTENKFDFCLFGALLGNARQLKRLMFSTQFGFKDSWLVPILSAIHSWKNMEILHLNTTQAFDSDYELLIDSGCWQRFKKSSLSSSDSELDESEKRPSEASLDFLISWLINSSARNLQFLRGDWKLSHRSSFGQDGTQQKLPFVIFGIQEIF